MSFVERGRFCQACQTVLTDFSLLSDDEIIRHIEKAAGGKMCGRFSSQQIDRPLIPDKKVHRIGTFRRVAASLFLFYASTYKTSAQTASPTHSAYNTDNSKKSATNATGTVIKGRVIDFTEQGVQGLELEIKETGMVKTTDAHGNFRFLVPDRVHFTKLTIGPTKNGGLFLDSIGAIIADSEVNLDTVLLKTSIVITLHPVTDLHGIEVTDKFIRRVSSQEIHVETFQSHGVTLLRGDTEKKTPLQKMKDFFKKKKTS